jgi:hypothetical protein
VSPKTAWQSKVGEQENVGEDAEDAAAWCDVINQRPLRLTGDISVRPGAGCL